METITITHIAGKELDFEMPVVHIPAEGKRFVFQENDGTPYMKGGGKEITIPHHFWLCAYQCTQEFWSVVVEEAGLEGLESEPSVFKGKTRPVEEVSWDDIQVFLEGLNGLLKTGKIIFKDDKKAPDGLQFQLPAEAEWEYAARAGTNTVYSGSDVLEDVGWYGKNSGRQTMPVGLKQPNMFGLYDMSGNVYEWCRNDSRQPDSLMLQRAERFNSFRGGNYGYYAEHCRVRHRYNSLPVFRPTNMGFRFGLFPSLITKAIMEKRIYPNR